MIHDAFAANTPSTKRLAETRDFLSPQKADQKDQKRTDWAKGAHHASSRDAWNELATPKREELHDLLAILPRGSWAIQFAFTLATPYLSKGIETFDLLDNPIIRDKVYEVPVVSASSWKGGLRAAALLCLTEGFQQEGARDGEMAQKDKRLLRLFGNPKGAEATVSAGRLHCFPTGFATTKCQVINPHDRARRVGHQPILLECVPEGESGTFTALYVPFGPDHGTDKTAQDLLLCAQALRDLLLNWGIGAKKSDGNGLAQINITNLYLGPQKSTNAPEPKMPALPDICADYETRFGTDYQTVKPKFWKPHDGARETDYRAARDAWKAYQDLVAAYPREHEEWEKRSKAHSPLIAHTKLSDLAASVQSHLIPMLMEEQH